MPSIRLLWLSARGDDLISPRLVIVGELSAAGCGGAACLFEGNLGRAGLAGGCPIQVWAGGAITVTAGQVTCRDAVRACPWCQPFRLTAGADI